MEDHQANATQKDKDSNIRDFIYQFRSNGSIKRLKVPLNLPYIRDAREQALRLIKLRHMPYHLEDDLYMKLQQFAKESSDDFLNQQAEGSLPNDSVFDKVSGADSMICDITTLIWWSAASKISQSQHSLKNG